jgi:DNA-directed RNA polymerase specialized sigma24 family protein
MDGSKVAGQVLATVRMPSRREPTMLQGSLIDPDASAIRRLAARMSQPQRVAIALRYAEDLSVAEIAAVMRLAVGEVQRLLQDAQALVRAELGGTDRPIARTA